MLKSFYTETILKSSYVHSLKEVRLLSMLEPVTRGKVQALMVEAKRLGHPLMLWESFRSKERQLELFKKKATKLKNVGVHHYGLACDLVKDVGGSPSWKGSFAFMRPLCVKYGLVWGGDWGAPGEPHNFIDLVHVQRITTKRQKALFAGTWYPDANYDPYQDGAS